MRRGRRGDLPEDRCRRATTRVQWCGPNESRFPRDKGKNSQGTTHGGTREQELGLPAQLLLFPFAPPQARRRVFEPSGVKRRLAATAQFRLRQTFHPVLMICLLCSWQSLAFHRIAGTIRLVYRGE